MDQIAVVQSPPSAVQLSRVISSIVQRGRFDLSDEKRTQTQLADALTAAGLPFAREHALSEGDVVDFLVAGILAVELKIKGSKKAIFRQLERYAGHDCVHAILLVSALAIPLPATIKGKPAATASLAFGWL